METGMNIFLAIFITFCFLFVVAWMAYEIFKSSVIEFDEKESINELKESE